MPRLHIGNLPRYKDLALLLWRHGGTALLEQTGLAAALDAEPAAEDRAEARELARDLEQLGPTYVKLGQLLSSRADLLPPAYLEALSRLQNRVEPFPFEEVEATIEAELGVRPSKPFAELESRPLAAASLGQVHRARLRDGRPVVVKVQRPGARERVLADLQAFHELAATVDHHTEIGRRYRFGRVLDQLETSLAAELDYRQEAANLEALGAALARFERLLVPRPVADLTSRRVLTMERIDGTPLSDLSPLARIELPGPELAQELLRAYLHQVLVDGLFHADPHPANLMATPDGRLALVDLGMVGHVRPEVQEHLLKLLLGLSDGDADQVAEETLRMSEVRPERFDRAGFEREVGEVAQQGRSSFAELETGRMLLEVAQIAGRHGVWVSPELTLLGRALLHLDEIGRMLDPDLAPARVVGEYAAELMNARMWKMASPGHLFSTVLETKELAERMPERLNKILDNLAENRLRVEVDALDEDRLMVGFQKIANRITLGVVIAALVVGAGLLMDVETEFTLLGYPGFAMICFLIALLAAGGLIWSIVRTDRPAHR